jgi:hypothetical protein
MTMLHESIAKALYKRHERSMKTSYNHAEIKARFARLPSKRAARIRAIPKVIDSIPNMVILSPYVEGEGKHSKLSIMGLERGGDTNGRTAWYGFLIRYKAKDATVEYADLPVVVTHHAIQRVMQRLGIKHPKAAMKTLAPAVMGALWLKEPSDKAAMLPMPQGVAFAVRDNLYPDCWAVVTFVDNAKLSQYQMQELADSALRIQKKANDFMVAEGIAA